MQVLVFAGYLWHGIVTAAVAGLLALMLPVVLLATWLGTRLYRRISEAAFRRLILLLLLASGCVLVATSLFG
jgi:uncharacterized membrane protein YfcA